MISPISSIGEFGVDGEVYALDWSSGDESDIGGGETGDTTTPAVSMEFAEGTKLEETVGVTASTPTASSVKQLTITPQGSLEKYSIYVQTTSSATGALVGKDKKETISAISDTTSTGGVALANIGVNQWGYALETGQKAADAMKYKGVSGSGTAVSAYDSIANPTSAQEFTLAFAANIGNDKPADHYIANVLVSVAANPGEVTTFYSVTYKGNGNTGGVIPATQIAESSNNTYTFAAPQKGDLVKTGYALIGWSQTPNATTPQYELGATITLDATSPSKTLYAIWRLPQLADIDNMQEMTPEVCGRSAKNNSKQLTDTRDGKTYWVAKLADGNCWMTQNLDYDDPDSTRRVGDTKPNSWPNELNLRQYWDPGEKIGSSFASAYGTVDKHLLIGNFYSYAAATAGTGLNVSSGEVSGSICPNGWKLPTGDESGSGSFAELLNDAGITNDETGWESIQKAPYYFLPGGFLRNNQLERAGSQGFYWSSTKNSTTSPRILTFVSTNVYPSSTGELFYGQFVRCLVQAPTMTTYTLNYDATSGSNPPAAQTVTTAEDSHTFTVASGSGLVPAFSDEVFLGWSLAGNNPQYPEGSQITLTKDSPTKTLYAVWASIY